jgi:Transposase IS4
VIAEDSPISTPQPSETPLVFPEFEKLVINQYDAEIRISEGTRDPFQLFSLFFNTQFLNMLVTATNSYAQRNYSDMKRPWKPLSLPELYVFLGCLVYMGVHPEHDMEGYWRTNPVIRGQFTNCLIT